ncbi:MAG: C-terminal helicase domain-containing protein [Pirellulaceae bacterium]
MAEERLAKRGAELSVDPTAKLPKLIDNDDFDDFEDQPGNELEVAEEEILDLATAARTIAELDAEIESLRILEHMARDVRNSGKDKKWEELSILLNDNEIMFDGDGNRHKLVIFTEHRDTLTYLSERIRNLLGSEEAVVTISGGMLREERKKSQEKFTQDKTTMVLIATDAAGEGINLQRAHSNGEL